LRTGKAVRRFGVVNADDPNAGYFRAVCPLAVLSYGIRRPADVRARDIALGADRASFVVESPIGTRRIETRLVGCFNVYNWLAAITVAIGQGLGWEAIERAAILAKPVRGRMQRIEAGQPFTVLVDFAHTPRALANVLDDCRRLTAGRVIVVFGHPGERYADNRPRLGAAAVDGAHLSIITSDDSYGEDPDWIIDGLVAGARAAGGVEGEDFLVVPDRREAIRRAVELARPGDLVLIAGRGHLTHREIGQRRFPFNDVRVARELIHRVRHPAA
jgi:UDP-N-acetylmuramoyl-L-alanyl-D-glutamate--2,6-diaminopimelate ligase